MNRLAHANRILVDAEAAYAELCPPVQTNARGSDLRAQVLDVTKAHAARLRLEHARVGVGDARRALVGAPKEDKQ